jgi:hypothetical protein
MAAFNGVITTSRSCNPVSQPFNTGRVCVLQIIILIIWCLTLFHSILYAPHFRNLTRFSFFLVHVDRIKNVNFDIKAFFVRWNRTHVETPMKIYDTHSNTHVAIKSAKLNAFVQICERSRTCGIPVYHNNRSLSFNTNKPIFTVSFLCVYCIVCVQMKFWCGCMRCD